VAARMTLTVRPPRARADFLLTGEWMTVSGSVTPYVAGQTVLVRFALDGRGVAQRRVAVLPAAAGAGRFRLGYASPRAGVVSVSATHAATAQMGAFAARGRELRAVPADLREGARGPAVWLLQSRLGALGYAVARDGVFDEGTGQAVIAYRKVNGLARVPATDARVFRLLQAGRGRFPVRFPRDGRHVEASLAKQVLAEIEPGGRVHRIYTISSGKPSTPTVLGRFRVYLKTPGANSEDMVDSNYFIRGYAIHGYPEVPTYAASHGCLRVPIPDAPAIYAWVRVGTPVDVYD
jgi:L,D-transpeptidase catalytic domain/Putative peptidoglycan binding domain